MTHDPEAAERLAQDAEISMTYRNWRGEVSQRTIRPVALWFGKTDWHPEPGWLLNAWDCGKGERRDFALADCQFTLINTPAPPTPAEPAGGALLREVLRDFREYVSTGIVYGTIMRGGEHHNPIWARVATALAAAPAPIPAPQPDADEREEIEDVGDALVAGIRRAVQRKREEG